MCKIVQSTSAILVASRGGKIRRLFGDELNRYSHWEPCMIGYLIATRAAIILWTNLAVMPAEILFEAIETELERRGVKL
jgi:hypothetical protein